MLFRSARHLDALVLCGVSVTDARQEIGDGVCHWHSVVVESWFGTGNLLLPAGLANAWNFTFQSELAEHVPAKPELAVYAFSASRYQATAAYAHRRTVAGKLLESDHVTCGLEFGTLGGILFGESNALLVTSNDAGLRHVDLRWVSLVCGKGNRIPGEEHKPLRPSVLR